jgi:tetratricopeptide (TPR) repeat protein
MKLVNILITEGRKEDLEKKYSKSLGKEVLDYVFNDPFIKKTNYKYGDFLLKNLSYPSKSEIESAISLLKKFDKFSKNLEKKDINQYEDLSDLSIELSDYKSKNQSKKIDETETEKVYEDPNILIVRPLTHKSSCKYGAGTRWCTTDLDKTHYDRYTSGAQGLYYIILKKFDQSNKFYKIAIHKSPSGEDEWYDAQDKPFSEREKEVFNLGVPKIIQTIDNHYDKLLEEKGGDLLNNVFDNDSVTASFEVSKDLKVDVPVYVVFRWPSKIDNNHYNVVMDLLIDGFVEDRYLLFILVSFDNNFINMNIELDGDDNFSPNIDTDLSGESISLQFGSEYFKSYTQEEGFKRVMNSVYNLFLKYGLKNDNKFRALTLKDPRKVWTPNRPSYGYTFKQNKGLIKQLVDSLNSGKKMTKLDFLVDNGKLDTKVENGKTLYSTPGTNMFRPSSEFRGQFSGFFNSAVLAGIISYDKEGQKYYIKKGPNFEDFVKGELTAL